MDTPVTKQELKRELNNVVIRIFAYIDEKSAQTNKRLDKHEEQLNRLFGLVDGYAKQTEIYHQEMIISDKRARRYDKRMVQIADRLKLKLDD